MKKTILAVIAFCMIGASAHAQVTSPVTSAAPRIADAEERLRLAASNGAYPVTPGDDYRLVFQQGAAPTTLDVLVGSDYTIQLNVFGKVNAAGMTFAQVKQIVEKAVAAAYPRSMPSLTISSVGVFQVFLAGETLEAQHVNAWGMSRLSDIVEGRLGAYSCLRNVEITSANGTKKEYDLFLYQRLGRADQNPSMKAGDTVVISSSERSVEITGEVKRPGKYQLLSSENFKELVDLFGGGLTAAADASRMRVDRVAGDVPKTMYASIGDETSPFVLQDGDVVTIPSKTAVLPVVFFEGALTAETPQGAPAPAPQESAGLFTPISYNRISYSFRQGETLKSALAAMRKSISPMADLSGAFLIHEGAAEPIPVDLAALISDTGTASDTPLRPLDRIVIPSAQFFVSVYGDVTRPGNYPYTPSTTYRHYADLAGFGDIEEIPENIVIMDAQGRRRSLQEFIEPGGRIYLTAARVTVQGAVVNPGNFVYRKDYSAMNYENLAGGFDPERSTNSKVLVFDSKGKPRKPADPIQPGDRIFVDADKFEYNFGRSLPILLSVVTAVTSIVTVYALLR